MKQVLLQSALGLKLGYSTINKVLPIIMLITIAMLIWGCEQKEPKQSEQKQNEQKIVDQQGSENKKSETKGGNPMVIMSTSIGDIKIELYLDKAPVTVNNFLAYVNDKFYDGSIFHRVIPGFMIQGGGFTPEMQQKATKPPIKNEANNGFKNDTGTIAMARTSVVDSATSQFFINLTDNDFLNRGNRDFGYAVFGKVVEGMDVVNKIAGVKTGNQGMHRDVPLEPVVVESIRVIEPVGK
ncbi:MAG: peptidyl-prolyl cis-trans isomerase A [Candidatus Dadabacteria bacterium CSP1-2]|jgi:peptidyl-prolyl cis-trans isomerase A (cyclophilin A)|nr:MAG: peptidyl-prolyl cis-trans isomerase A [Candidatus Dadabacteria bacterium CSP1-2]